MSSFAIAIPARLRPDLQWSRYANDCPGLWVAHDPACREFYFFSSIEKAIASQLDGKTSFNELLQKCRQMDASVTPSFVTNLVQRLDQSSLLLNQRWQPRRSRSTTILDDISTAISSLLALRIPLLNPSPLLRVLEPLGKILFSWWMLFLVMASWIVCILLLGQSWAKLSTDLVALQSSLQGDRLLLAGLLLLIIKAFHEFGHALACRWAGAECKEIGVSFFFGLPCLYCDVSDSWRVSNRWKRMLVSAAGIMAELIVALITCVIWLTSPEPWVRTIALQIMLYCSVVTILINANPLLRYDGYYILSDGLAVPNLAEQAREAWSRTWRSWLFHAPRSRAWLSRTVLVAFHLASTLYRWFLLAVLIWSCNRWLFQNRLGGFASIITAVIALSMLTNVLRHLKSSSLYRGEVATIRWFRGALTILALGLLGYLIATWKFPGYLFTRGVIESADVVTLYARHPSFVSRVPASGSFVSSESIAVEMESPELALQQIQAKGEWESARVRLQQASNRSIDDPLAARQSAELERIAVSREEEFRKLDRQLHEIQVRSSFSGWFSDRQLDRSTADFSGRSSGLAPWLGSIAADRPFIERGESIGTVRTSKRLQLKTFISEQDINQCQIGVRVRVRLDQIPGKILLGQVKSISTETLQRTPRILMGDSLFAASIANSSSESKPELNSYSVIVELNEHHLRPIVNGLASVQISIPPTTLLDLWIEMLRRVWSINPGSA